MLLTKFATKLLQQLSHLFIENCYFKFQNEIQFFHITTMEL